ncbi:MAG: SpoIVB peptidase [Firmicutes bacterium]|nr:SpoIVB peptidase [Bacillota bacterium]
MGDANFGRKEGMLVKKRKRRYKTLIWSVFSVAAAALLGGWLFYTWEKIPASIRIKAGSEQELSLNVPVMGEIYSPYREKEEVIPVNLSRPVTVMANRMQEYTMDVKLFGVIPFKTVNVQVIPDKMLVPAGVPIGIYVKTDGILVIAQGDFEGMDHTRKEPAKHLLQAGDYILKADEQEVVSKADFTKKISESGGRDMVLTIRREEEIFDIKVHPEQNVNGEYKLGIWIRDNAQGVGTMTYLDEDASFGALGHGINDTDTALLMEVKGGSLYKTEIIAIKKGQGGTPGELTGVIDYNLSNKIGTIDTNSVEGIFGTVDLKGVDTVSREAMPIGLKQDVEPGKAQILCCVDGEKIPKSYDVNIKAVHLDHDNINRGIELEVTDAALLEQTGGIVQGMSGSPILQNGKIVGAVTHVLVNDPTRGYGIFIENMLETAG